MSYIDRRRAIPDEFMKEVTVTTRSVGRLGIHYIIYHHPTKQSVSGSTQGSRFKLETELLERLLDRTKIVH